VLSACERSTVKGKRDYALLLLLARLGLRAGEIVALQLDDIDWANGELTVRSKNWDGWVRLPLPVDAGIRGRGQPANRVVGKTHTLEQMVKDGLSPTDARKALKAKAPALVLARDNQVVIQRRAQLLAQRQANTRDKKRGQRL
jgi:integrase